MDTGYVRKKLVPTSLFLLLPGKLDEETGMWRVEVRGYDETVLPSMLVTYSHAARQSPGGRDGHHEAGVENLLSPRSPCCQPASYCFCCLRSSFHSPGGR